jgi:hypothetical protein
MRSSRNISFKETADRLQAVGAQQFIISSDFGLTRESLATRWAGVARCRADVEGDHEGADPDDGAREAREAVDGLAAGNAEVGVGLDGVTPASWTRTGRLAGADRTTQTVGRAMNGWLWILVGLAFLGLERLTPGRLLRVVLRRRRPPRRG